MKIRTGNIERIRRELEDEGISVKNNPDTCLIVSAINSLSNWVAGFGLAIIAVIVTFGLALMSAL